ncbi:MAG: hypothetical protein GX286_01760 [Clostridiales bacterium]|jgi:hypothetical protein|nr:hypothetical protein [Clostridiales bacterium]
MNIREIKHEARLVLKERYWEAFVVVFACFGLYMLFKLVEIVVCTVLIYNKTIDISQLFYGGDTIWNVFKTMYSVFLFAAMVPVITGAVWWFSQAANRNEFSSDSVIQLYTCFKVNSRAILVYGLMWIIQFLSLIPSFIMLLGAYLIIEYYNISSDILYLAVQLIILSVASLALYIRATLSLILAPYIFIRHPMDNPFSIISISFRLMKGRKMQVLKLLLSYIGYLFLMALIVTIPFVVPEIMMSVTIFAESVASEYAIKQVKKEKVKTRTRRSEIGDIEVQGGMQ